MPLVSSNGDSIVRQLLAPLQVVERSCVQQTSLCNSPCLCFHEFDETFRLLFIARNQEIIQEGSQVHLTLLLDLLHHRGLRDILNHAILTSHCAQAFELSWSISLPRRCPSKVAYRSLSRSLRLHQLAAPSVERRP